MKLEKSYSSTYEDVKSDKWYYQTLGLAEDTGIIRAGLQFNPDVAITREDMMSIIVDALRYKGVYESLDSTEIDEILSVFDDSGNLTLKNREAVAYAVKTGIITGRSETTLAPKDTATRAETIVVIKRLLDQLGL